MTTTQSNESTIARSPEQRSTNTLRDGLVGGIVGILLTFLPLSTVIGGGVAGYLQENGAEGKTGRSGALAGGISFIPQLVGGLYLIVVMGIGPTAIPVGYLLLGFVGVGVIYAIGLGVLGALLGAYIRREHIDA